MRGNSRIFAKHLDPLDFGEEFMGERLEVPLKQYFLKRLLNKLLILKFAPVVIN
jgi:hypothetical protein